MHVVMTRTRKNEFHFGLDIIRDIDDDIERLINNDEIKAGLRLGLHDNLDKDFKLWDDRIIPNPGQNKDAYENFIMGYFDRHDLLESGCDHSVYFRWDGRRVRVFVAPLNVEHVSTLEPVEHISTRATTPVESVIVDAAATSDPPPVGAPPPPLAK